MMTRRQFFGLCAAAPAALAADAWIEPRLLDCAEYEILIEGLPRSLDGFSIAHLTDLHLRSLGRVHAAILTALSERAVQLVAITGDVIDAESGAPGRAALEEFLGELAGGARQIAVTLGNHEHNPAVDRARLARTYASRGARLLVNESALFGPVAVVGTDDGGTGRADLRVSIRPKRRALKRAPVRLLLTHAPGYLDQIKAERAPPFHLSLAGHTHGGQVRAGPWAIVTPPGSGRFVSGFYDAPLGRAYVSRGVGMIGPQIRVMCTPELPIFVLRRA